MRLWERNSWILKIGDRLLSHISSSRLIPIVKLLEILLGRKASLPEFPNAVVPAGSPPLSVGPFWKSCDRHQALSLLLFESAWRVITPGAGPSEVQTREEAWLGKRGDAGPLAELPASLRAVTTTFSLVADARTCTCFSPHGPGAAQVGMQGEEEA